MNPWQVQSLDAFNYLCCPECVFRSKETQLFENHAVLNHPQSSVFFNDSKDFKEVDDSYEPFEDSIEPVETNISDHESDFLELKINPEEVEEHDTKNDFFEIEETSVKIKDESDDSEDEPLIVKLNYKFKCFYCPEKFPTAGTRSYHLRAKCTLKKFTCMVCNAEFKKRGAFLMHNRMYHSKGVKCPQCNESCKNRTYLRLHINKVHKEQKPPNHHCHLCNKVFKTKQLVTKHIENVHGDKMSKKYECIICGYKTHSKEYMKNHDFRYHIEDSTNYFDIDDIRVDNDGNVQCPSCDKILHQSKYIVHYKDVHKTFPPNYPDHRKFMCEQCPEIFVNQKSMETHVRKVHENCTEDQAFCDKCGKQFASEARLKMHLAKVCQNPKKKRRQGPKLIHECPHCTKVFKARMNCQEHIKKVHEQDTPFHCDECPMSFGLQQILKNHKQVKHTRLQCDICHAILYNYFYLKNHKYQVHHVIPEGALTCQICAKIFMNKGGLKNHMESKHYTNM